jgi:CHAD domain-containing protein
MKRLLRDPNSGYAELHEVRIAAKKVRYLLEFFAPVIESGNGIGVVELTQIQDELGKLNDVVASESLLVTHALRLGERGIADDAIAYLRDLKGDRMQSAEALLRALSDRLVDERPGFGIN